MLDAGSKNPGCSGLFPISNCDGSVVQARRDPEMAMSVLNHSDLLDRKWRTEKTPPAAEHERVSRASQPQTGREIAPNSPKGVVLKYF